MTTHTDELLERYRAALVPVFGVPQTVLDHGDGCYVVDVDGKRYLDLLGGIAVNTLGHGHPAIVEAITKQVSQVMHISNFFASRPQVELAEALLRVCRAPEGSGVFFANSGAEAIEAALKLTRRTGRHRVIAMEHAFHGRTMGALSLTWKPAYREPFEPLVPGVSHVPYGDPDALRAAVAEAGDDLAAVLLEPIQGEAGVIVLDEDYLRLARELTRDAGALLVLDEIQCGMGRTGHWLAHHATDVVPDAVTLAKGLAGGVPVGALVTYGPHVTGLLQGGQHGSTFGGNPLACAAGLATIRTVESDGLLENAAAMGRALTEGVLALGHPRVAGVRGRGLLLAITLTEPVAASAMTVAREAGFLVNAVAPDALRLAPPLVLGPAEVESFLAALPGVLDAAVPPSSPAS
ncbi:acetylornithine transaminase [Lapillicoccus jejuensis]|uniref:Acetylornithine aminotransferase n=1 Tax=Lapillicoccus jejuensis TaxID=402171 RepID=A0A542E6P5_9MICO|nr:acetylornithine transaminase [Lapillicoccus jejuensis]TQJ10984.1 acetylornithine aminotransferase [Lapillicoccus jejuensis]